MKPLREKIHVTGEFEMRLQIGVIGGSAPREKHKRMAHEVGMLLARKGIAVICGGLSGIMESVAEGVEKEGGICVGLLPGLSPLEGNTHLTVGLPTGIGFARNFLVVRASDAIIAIDGSNGTLSEAAFALTEGKSVISLDSFKLSRQKGTEGYIIEAATPAEGVELAIREASRKRRDYAAGRVRIVEHG